MCTGASADGPNQPVCVPGTVGFGDYDEHGDIALPDIEALTKCLSGPDDAVAVPFPLLPERCLAAFDSEQDDDIDLRDAARVLRTFTGACAGLGQCPDGWHLVHASGVTDVPDPDTFDPASADVSEFRCEPDQTCDGVDCSGNGRCMVVSGEASCACDRGYAGQFCEVCAVGYEWDTVNGMCILGKECRDRLCSGQGDCQDDGTSIICVCDPGTRGEFCESGVTVENELQFRPPTRIRIDGTDTSVVLSETRVLTATLFGGGVVDQELDWSLEGPGSLSRTKGSQVFYVAPRELPGNRSRVVKIEICSDSFADRCTTRYLTLDPPGAIRSTGQSTAVFRPFDEAMRTFMRHRCVGGAILGISLFGKPVYVRGYGNLSGAPTNDPAYLETCGDTFDVSSEITGFPLPEPSPVLPTSPFRIGSISKSVAAAVLRDAVKENIIDTPNPTDDHVEALHLCAIEQLLPPALRAVLCDGAAPPVPLNSLSGIAPDCDASDPCPYGGSCEEIQPGVDACTSCPPGFGGADCSFSLADCPDVTTGADSRWGDVTLGHLMGHLSGLPRSGPDVNVLTLPNVELFRGLSSEADYAAQEALLTSEGGWPGGDFLDEFPLFPAASAAIGGNGYFIPRISTEEALLTRAGACLAYPPGGPVPAGFDNYSNTAYAFIGVIEEYITGLPLAGKPGKPGLHSGSLIETFFDTHIGLPVPGQATDEGILYSQDVFASRNPLEPVYRSWSTQNGGTYYKMVSDGKRPHCIWNDNAADCDFGDWTSESLRYDWNFQNQDTLDGYQGAGTVSPHAAGSLATEAEVFLKFMAKYWVGGSGEDPDYGETRCPDGNCIWTSSHAHNGARVGTWAEAKQLGGTTWTDVTCSSDADCGSYATCGGTKTAHEICLGGYCHRLSEYRIPPYDICEDEISDDFVNITCDTCRLPVGVDIFVALNQRRDKKCAEAEALGEDDPNYYSCDDAYGTLDDFMLWAACQVPWPPNPFVIWPPVLLNGSSGMTGGILSGGYAARAGFECCGNGVRDGAEYCDGTDFGGKSCASFGFEMGDLSCNACYIDLSGCSGGIGPPPASYLDCGYSGDACDWDPGACDSDGSCPGGPCARVDKGDIDGALDPYSAFHPDGIYRDAEGELYYCPGSNFVCGDHNGWSVCLQCTGNGELSTRLGCPCESNENCMGVEPGLACFGEDYGNGPGFCWDENEGPPDWQCPEGACGMAPWYGDDIMYCEHYSLSGVAHCEPWWACNAVLSRKCAGQGLICEENAGGCTSDSCCTAGCQEPYQCDENFGWPPNFECLNTPQGLQCVHP